MRLATDEPYKPSLVKESFVVLKHSWANLSVIAVSCFSTLDLDDFVLFSGFTIYIYIYKIGAKKVETFQTTATVLVLEG